MKKAKSQGFSKSLESHFLKRKNGEVREEKVLQTKNRSRPKPIYDRFFYAFNNSI